MKSPKTFLALLACLIVGTAYIGLAEEPSQAGDNINVPTGTFGGMQLWETAQHTPCACDPTRLYR